MKTTISLLILFLSLNLIAQNPLSFSKVVDLGSGTTEEIHNKVVSWFATTYEHPEEVIQVDQETHVMGKAIMDYYPNDQIKHKKNATGIIEYSIHVYIKEGRFKCEMNNMSHDARPPLTAFGDERVGYSFYDLTDEKEYTKKMWGVSKSWKNNVWADIKDQAKLYSEVLFSSLEKALKTDDDW